MSPRKLGQHSLADASWQSRILEKLPRDPRDVWVEIGAGRGEMTRGLARGARRVVAIELDTRLIEGLRAATSDLAQVHVVSGDILRLELPQVAGERFKVFGNLPYYITSPILHRLFQWTEHIDAIAIVVQFEVAARLVAPPGRRQYGYLSVLTQFHMRPEIALRIPPGAFRPPPKVASALVRMHPPGERQRHGALGIRDEAHFLQFVQACFAQKRKTLLNNLRVHLSAADAGNLLEAAGLRRDVRAEQLRVTQFVDLFQRLQSGQEGESQKSRA